MMIRTTTCSIFRKHQAISNTSGGDRRIDHGPVSVIFGVVYNDYSIICLKLHAKYFGPVT